MDTRERTFYFALLTAGVFLAAVIISFTQTILRHHKRLLTVYKDKVLTEITTLEIERKRIASDLHDDIGPILSTIHLHLDCLNTVDAEDNRLIEHCTVLITEAIQKIRETSRNLISDVLEEKGLIQAIKDVAAIISKTKQLEIEIDITINDTNLDRRSELHLFRIFQEVLVNCVKHSGANIFTLKIEQKKNILLLDMRDDGCGFDYKNILESKIGLGLRNIANRVEVLNGQMFIDSQIHNGVRYTIEIANK